MTRAACRFLVLALALAFPAIGCDSADDDPGASPGDGSDQNFPTRGDPTDPPPTGTPNPNPSPSPGCTPACAGKICGDDGCGGSCGSCSVGLSCDLTTGQCCLASCKTASGVQKTCGGDGCGGICGQCNAGQLCDENLGSCVADSSGCSCTGKVCGDDGCGNSCGTCPASQSCTEGQCVAAGGVGSGSCESVMICSWACAADLPECVQGCIATGTLSAQAEFDVVQACFDQYNCENMECMGVNCATPVAGCLYDASGALGCGDILGCQLPCVDEACLKSCIQQGHVPAQAAYTTLNFCVQYYCPTFDQSCIDDGQQGGQSALWDYTKCAHWYDKCIGI